MNPGPTPAAHLPAPLPFPAALLHRTQAALGLLRDVVQESSAEYWYERGKAAMAQENWEEATYAFQICLTKYNKHWKSKLQLVASLIRLGKNNDATNHFEEIYSEPTMTWLEFISELSENQWKTLSVLGVSGSGFDLAGVPKILIEALLSCVTENISWVHICVAELIDLYSEEEYDKSALFHWLEGRMRASFYDDYVEARISYSRCLYRRPNFVWAEQDREQLPERKSEKEGHDDPFKYLY